MLHPAVDIGGTFTDICVFDEGSGATRVGKVSSTRDPIDAVFEGIEEVGVSPGQLGTLEAIRWHGMILDWGTGEFLPNTTEGFRAMLHRRSTSHWKNGEASA